MSYILDSISSCPIDSECIPIKTCAPIISQLSLAKETEDVERKRKIISQVREKVCGDRRDRLICCPQATPDVVGRSPGNDERYHTYTIYLTDIYFQWKSVHSGTFITTLVVSRTLWMSRTFWSRTSPMTARAPTPSSWPGPAGSLPASVETWCCPTPTRGNTSPTRTRTSRSCWGPSTGPRMWCWPCPPGTRPPTSSRD